MGFRDAEGFPGVMEAGIVCPSCGTFFRAEYTNKRLIGMYREYKREKRFVQKQALLRAYKRKNMAFQLEVLQLKLKRDLENERLKEPTQV